MRIKYLGTAAAEGVPGIFCDCENCKRARKLGGKNIRTRSQAILDDTLLIDFPADTYMHFLRFNLPLTKIKSCIITHSHMDHLYPVEFEMRINGYAHVDSGEPLTLYSAESGYNMVKEVIDRYNISEQDLRAVLIKPFETFEADGYRITPIKASHDPKSTPVVFAIEKDGKRLLYFNDTSALCEESMECLKTFSDQPFDLISLDCTEACNEMNYVGHMNLKRCIATRKVFYEIGVADEHTEFVLNHFSHNGKNGIYDDFAKIAAEEDFLVSYDGMELEF